MQFEVACSRARKTLAYRVGKTASVGVVEVSRPPMTEAAFVRR